MNVVIILRVPQNFGKFLSDSATGGFLRRTQLRGVRERKVFSISAAVSE
jgi:hypothetical protein